MRYSKEVVDFIYSNVKGNRVTELVELTNNTMGTEFTISKMKAFMKNHKLRNEMPKSIKGKCRIIFPKEIINFINDNLHLYGAKNMTDKINEVFGTSYTRNQIHGYYNRNKLSSGLSGYFEKGSIPFNKGKKKFWKGGEATQFKKGNIPYSYLPVGTEVINTDGYTEIKIADPKTWKFKHIMVWESINGKVPKDHCIIFGDGNRQNFDINNLICVSRSQLGTLNIKGLIFDDAELTRLGIAVADVVHKTYKLKNRI